MIDGWREELAAETEHRRDERIAAQWTRRLGWFTAVAEAARLAGCSRQRLHEACRSYAEFSIRNAAKRGCSLGPYDGTLSDQMQMRRWGRAEAKPMSRDLTAPRAEYLARVWGRLVAGYDRASDEAERERAADQARLVAGDYRDADEIAGDEAAARPVARQYPPHQLGAVAAFVKLQARRGGTDFSAEAIAAAMTGSGYSGRADRRAARRAQGRRPLRCHPGRGGRGWAGRLNWVANREKP